MTGEGGTKLPSFQTSKLPNFQTSKLLNFHLRVQKKAPRVGGLFWRGGEVYLTWKEGRCQMSSAYSRMVRSLENLPAEATFIREALFQAVWSR